MGSPAATFAIRGLLEADCSTATCQVNAPLDLDGGTYFVRLRAETVRENKALVQRIVVVR